MFSTNQISASSDDSGLRISSIILGVGVILTLLIPRYYRWRTRMAQLAAIPTVPSSASTSLWSSYKSAWSYFKNPREIIQEGYKKYPGRAFKVPQFDGWTVVVSGNQLVEELKKADDDVLSFYESVADTLQTEYTIGTVLQDPFHIAVVRSPLTRNLAAKFGVLSDEIGAAFKEVIDSSGGGNPASEVKGSEWVTVPLVKSVMQIVCRTSNRVFVGLPLCRDPDWLDLNIRFTIDTFLGAKLINLFPTFLKPIVGRLLTHVPAGFKRGTKHLRPIIEQRLLQDEAEKPNDLITWLLDEIQTTKDWGMLSNIRTNPKILERVVYEVVSRVLSVNLAAIHTTSVSLTNTLHHLAASPDPGLASALRADAEDAIREHGWTKAAMGKMWKLDSFLKETQRLDGIIVLSMQRKAMKDHTFSDGTTVPEGMIVSAAAYGLHHDEAIYSDAETMNAFRFSDAREAESERIKHQMVTPDAGFLLFGSGRHACPGRFFAVNELKALLAHILINYDIKFAPPKDGSKMHDPTKAFLNQDAEMMFKRRSHAAEDLLD